MLLNLNDPRSIVSWWRVCPARHNGYLETLLATRPQFAGAIRRAQRQIAANPELQALLAGSIQERSEQLALEAHRDANMLAQQARWRELAIAA